ncbi:cytochrome c oxidase subunit 3 family protein [Solimonas sp. K1W22B-7]|uniref:cytochrome c oxidase subunit 3 n=1 Tax=Solimonas sp. K1W22B-7 TaxID=2303331 RepID=UPI000E336B7E|nr:cytochrome c oxidase subunit 3 [Solimonas sp. K1W22B-7]AXQ28544.1 cytochrome c oxidase subunit 3 family protein [Solimonas sp. K1W22B-7]
MANASAAVAVPASEDSEAGKSIPGELDIWLFVGFEVLVFSSYFIVYMLYRSWNPEIFLQSQQQLSQNFGVVNTVILLVSSWLIARAVQSTRENQYAAAQRQVFMTLSCGLLFVGSKLLEWSMKIREGFEFSTNPFFTFYYFLTGIHILHVLMGFIFLGVVAYQIHSPLRRSRTVIEAGAIYWHMVDFLWVIIFALLYVMR